MDPHDIPFFDAHVHFWDLDHLSYPWLTPPFEANGVAGSVEPIASTYRPEHYRAETRRWNVIGAVHVDAGAAPEDALPETRWLQTLADQAGLPQAIVAYVPLDDVNAERLISEHSLHPNVRGVRHIVNWHENAFYSYTPFNLLTDPAWERGFAALARYGLSFDLQAYPAQIDTAAQIAQRHPDVPVILNHAGMPLVHERDGQAQWRRNMLKLAAVPHAAVKISGFGIIDHNWTIDSIRPYVLETIEMFGTNRCMFASDFPTDRLYADLDRVLSAYHAIVAAFSGDEKRAMFTENAVRIYRCSQPDNMGCTPSALRT
jgi:predicted TIM-barrel fold metal-dependent hydrolase